MTRVEQAQAISLEAAADLSASQFLFVVCDSAGKAALAGAEGNAIGVLQNKPVAGQPAEVAYAGVAKVIAGAAVAAGARVESDAAGKAVTVAGANSVVLGFALTASSATGQLIEILLKSNAIQP